MTDMALAPAKAATRRPLWRIAAIALFLGLPLGCVTLAGLAATTALEADGIADHADETARAIVHRLGRTPDAVQPRPDAAALYLASHSASLARAELQALGARLIDTAGGRLIEARPGEEAADDPAGRVSIDTTLAIDNGGLLDLLHAIETGLPVLTVPRLDIRSDPGSDGRPGRELQVTLTLEGRWKAAAP